MSETDQCFLHKVAEGEHFGPISAEELSLWAAETKISPADRVSIDNEATWMRAPAFEALNMYWLIEVEPGFLYGPTTMGAVQQFLHNQEIDGETKLINTKTRETTFCGDVPALQSEFQTPTPPDPPQVKEGSEIATSLQDKVKQLEELVLEQRQALQNSEERYQKLVKDMEE